MSIPGEKAKFKEAISALVVDFNSSPDETFLGSGPGAILEHVTRRHFVDPLLSELGWDLTRLNAEVIEEARTRAETTLRLDYLGVNQSTRVPLIILEAKAWAAPFVSASNSAGNSDQLLGSSPISLICAAIEHIKSGDQLEDSPVTGEWTEHLTKLREYVQSVRDESGGHVVTRVAILSGQWLVIFDDPEAVFLTPGKVSSILVNAYRGSELVSCSDDIFDRLARRSISNALPSIIRPSRLRAYCNSDDLKKTYRALWVSRHPMGAHWKPRPNIDLNAAVVVERRDGAMVAIVDDALPGLPVPHQYEDLTDHIRHVAELLDELLGRVESELGVSLDPAAVDSFPGFGANELISSNAPRVDLIKLATGPHEFLLVLSASKHFLLEAPSVARCDCHDWAFCQTHGQQQGSAPIYGRSVEPKSFFTTLEKHHCANRIVHDRRESRCQIDAFEKFLCCRACILQSFCWSSVELDELPCGMCTAVTDVS